jgi:hypothetical protein
MKITGKDDLAHIIPESSLLRYARNKRQKDNDHSPRIERRRFALKIQLAPLGIEL